MNFKNLIYAFTMFALLLNCSSGDSDSMSQPIPDPDPNPTTKITYNADVKAIIDNNCISCHGNTPSAPMSLTTYIQVKNNVNNIISRISSSSGIMPPPPNNPLSNNEKSLIQQWKTDGLLEN